MHRLAGSVHFYKCISYFRFQVKLQLLLEIKLVLSVIAGMCEALKVKTCVQLFMGNPSHSQGRHLTHLLYGFTQWYLPPDTSEHASL